jgi:dTDP-glucose 4,6-dehydratase
MNRLLVTGGAGFIGANFVHYWLQRHVNDTVVVLDALTYAGNLTSLPASQSFPRYDFVHGDIRDRKLVESLLRTREIDTIVHFAAESHVDRSISGPDPFIDVNIAGTHTLLEGARSVWLDRPRQGRDHRFHHVSTDEVYGSLGPGDPPFTEASPYAPNSPYAASKAAADHLVRAYHKTYGLETTISNCSNNYGPYHHPEKLIPLCILNLLTGKELPIYGDGSNVRDWLYVEDHCRGIELVLESGRSGETYNLGGGTEKTNLELVEDLCRLVDLAFSTDRKLATRFPQAAPARGAHAQDLIRFVADRPGHDQRYAINAGKARRQLGFETETDLDEGLSRTLRWYLENKEWWQAILDGSYRDWIEQHYGNRT